MADVDVNSLLSSIERTTIDKNTQGDKRTNSDPRGANMLRGNTLNELRGDIVQGVIIETCPSANAYKVALGGARAPLLCCALQHAGNNTMLMKDSGSYAEGVAVLVAIYSRAEFGIILGAIPPALDGKDIIVRDYISNASQNCPDKIDDACLDLATEENPYVGISNFAQFQPIDTTSIGSAGYTSLTGSKFHINPFMNTLSVNDFTGIWEFVDDGLLRLSGINLQVRTTGREEDYLNDNGEYIEYRGTSIYPWEQLGKTKPPMSSEEIITASEEEEYRERDTWKSYVEPKEEKTKPFHRVEEYGGWLGQGKYTQIVSPDPEKDWITYEEKETLQGILRTTETVDGYISSIATNGTFIGKRGLIPSVSRVNRPDETSTKIGDNKDNYKKTNKFDAETAIPRKGKPMEHVMGLQDSIAYQQNFKELLPFLQHTNDYHIPEDSDLNSGLTRFANFSALGDKQLIEVKEEKDVKLVSEGIVSERKFKLNPADAGIACLSDGSVVQYGGCGEEVRMTGGSIFMDTPGDIWFKSGRKIILWAGDDIEIRAKGHLDISTTEGSVRIKAEGKLSMLGGNNEKDGVLIESKGKEEYYKFEGGERDQFGGILLKSASNVSVLGETVYLRSGTNGGGDGIFFDANNGGHSIYTLCNSNVNYLEKGFEMNFANLKTGEINSAHRFTKDSVDLSSSLTVTGVAQITEDISTGSSIYAVGHIYTGEARSTGGYVSDYSLNKDQLKKQLQEKEDRISQEGLEQATQDYDTYIQGYLTSEGGIASEENLKNAGFSFRKSEEYNLPEDFAVYESRWQNIAQNANQGITEWKEKSVKGVSYEDTYPFPGKEAYTGTPCYITQAWTLTDYYTGLYKDRKSGDDIADGYKNPSFGEQQQKTLNEYPVI